MYDFKSAVRGIVEHVLGGWALYVHNDLETGRLGQASGDSKEGRLKSARHRKDRVRHHVEYSHLQVVSQPPAVLRQSARNGKKLCSILAWAANAGNKKRRPTGAGRRDRNKVCSGWNKVREVVWVDEWSRLPSGRIDRGALAPPKPDRVRCSSAPFAEPRDADERAIAAIWANVLQLDEVGIDDDFLSLGGDSLTATVIAGRLSLHFATECSAARIFECGTIAVLALAIRISLEGDTLARLLTDVESLTPDEVERQLSAREQPHMPASGEI